MKILTWETAKKEGAKEALDKVKAMIMADNLERESNGFYMPSWTKKIANDIEKLKEQYK